MVLRTKHLTLLDARLDEIRMSDFDRQIARAHLARADAVAEMMVALGRGVKSLVCALLVRPIRRLAESLY